MSSQIFIIAEAGVNHNGSLKRAVKMVEAAKRAGVNAVKFQLFVPELLVTPKVEMSSYQKKNLGTTMSQLRMLQAYRLSKSMLQELSKYARRHEIRLLVTPFDRESLRILLETKPAALKVDSGAIVDHPFLGEIAAARVPVILSTGASTLKEVKEAVTVIEQFHRKISLLHCTSMYPAPFHRVNLNAMRTMMEEFRYPVGYSDHSLGIEVSVAAAAMGARLIEKHFTLDRRLPGPDHKASAHPDELTAMVRAIRNVEKALGSFEKKPCPEEMRIMRCGRRSIVTIDRVRKGETFSRNNIAVKRPGTGLHPKYFKDVLGRIASCQIASSKPLSASYIKGFKAYGG